MRFWWCKCRWGGGYGPGFSNYIGIRRLCPKCWEKRADDRPDDVPPPKQTPSPSPPPSKVLLLLSASNSRHLPMSTKIWYCCK